eukprot:scaffold2927_cov408-Prasinococcus_capsulatus_cf.AAC.20
MPCAAIYYPKQVPPPCNGSERMHAVQHVPGSDTLQALANSALQESYDALPTRAVERSHSAPLTAA